MSENDLIKILWDGESVIAVEKPAALLTQAPPNIDSLERRLRRQLSSRSDYLAIVHRLDRTVSGVVLVALRKKAAGLLSDQFATRKTEKRYLAVVAGKVSSASACWQDYLRKITDKPQAECCSEHCEGAKLAETEVKILRMVSGIDSSPRTLLQMQPITGRMHQLRIQAASRGVPIVGDLLYAKDLDERDARLFSEVAQTGRILLHCESITFYHPQNGRRTTVCCPADDCDAWREGAKFECT